MRFLRTRSDNQPARIVSLIISIVFHTLADVNHTTPVRATDASNAKRDVIQTQNQNPTARAVRPSDSMLNRTCRTFTLSATR